MTRIDLRPVRRRTAFYAVAALLLALLLAMAMAGGAAEAKGKSIEFKNVPTDWEITSGTASTVGKIRARGVNRKRITYELTSSDVFSIDAKSGKVSYNGEAFPIITDTALLLITANDKKDRLPSVTVAVSVAVNPAPLQAADGAMTPDTSPCAGNPDPKCTTDPKYKEWIKKNDPDTYTQYAAAGFDKILKRVSQSVYYSGNCGTSGHETCYPYTKSPPRRAPYRQQGWPVGPAVFPSSAVYESAINRAAARGIDLGGGNILTGDAAKARLRSTTSRGLIPVRLPEQGGQCESGEATLTAQLPSGSLTSDARVQYSNYVACTSPDIIMESRILVIQGRPRH